MSLADDLFQRYNHMMTSNMSSPTMYRVFYDDGMLVYIDHKQLPFFRLDQWCKKRGIDVKCMTLVDFEVLVFEHGIMK